MTVAFWCVFLAALFPYPLDVMAKRSRRYDNHRPRDYLEQTQGWRRRAYWAQLNSFEAFPPFAAAVIIAHLAEGPGPWIDGLAVAFIFFRLVYAGCYLADRATWRSVVWSAGFACVVGLFVVAA